MDGRSVVLLPESDGYSSLDLVLGESGIRVTELRRRSEAQLHAEASDLALFPERTGVTRTSPIACSSGRRRSDRRRRPSWRRPRGKGFAIDDRRLSFLLRDSFNAEISLVEAGAIHRSVWHHDVSRSDVIIAVNQDFNLFVYRLTGKQLKKVEAKGKSLLINGLEDGRVQGYRIEAKREYRVVSTQATFDRVERILGELSSLQELVDTVTDLLLADLQGQGRDLSRRLRLPGPTVSDHRGLLAVQLLRSCLCQQGRG